MPRARPFLLPPIVPLHTPPPSQTGSESVRSLTETKPDFTTVIDVPPLVYVSADEILQDEQRMKKLTVALCDAIFSYPDQATVDKVIDDSLRLCGGSEEALSAALQTKFFAGHTPFYWAIMNKDPKQEGVPPLLQKFLSICSNTVDETTQADMIWGLLRIKESEDSLYQLIKQYLGTDGTWSLTSIFRDKEPQPTVLATSTGIGGYGCTVKFCIPLLFDRLVSDKEVRLTFIAMGSLWRLKAITTCPSDWAWHFELTEVRSKNAYSTQKYKRKVTVKLECSAGAQPPLLCSSEQEIGSIPSTVKVSIPNSDLQGFYHNPYTAKQTRELVGTLEIKDTRLILI